MAEPPRKEFGRRGMAPPVVTHAPKGLPGGASPSPFRKRSLAIAVIAVGSLSIGALALMEKPRRDCPEGADPERQDCSHSSSHSSSHGGSGGHSYSSGSSSSSSHSSSGESASGHAGGSSLGHAVSFSGFGGSGAGHGGGS
ncbi:MULTISPECIES: hypothetical protein [unclassified Methylosinus]|uniref:hypothetical protein n=1 Tax=unclassified Methylosinus TaxID=2624500 RepID=UPI000A8A8E85|nr:MULTISPECIES: hypothetical protein [unclassified Methylosinus]